MRSSKKNSLDKQESESFILPSEDMDNDKLTDKGLDSSRHYFYSKNPQNRNPLVPALDLSFPESRDDRSNSGQNKKKNQPQNQTSSQAQEKKSESTNLVSPIESFRDKDDVKDPEKRKASEKDKTDGVLSNGGSSNDSTQKNPQSYMSSGIRNQDPNKQSPQPQQNSSPIQNKQPGIKSQDSNVQASQSAHFKYQKIPGGLKDGLKSKPGHSATNPPDLSLEQYESLQEIAKERQRQRDKIFNDSLVSTIKGPQQYGFTELGEDQENFDEDTSAKRLLSNGQTDIVRTKNNIHSNQGPAKNLQTPQTEVQRQSSLKIHPEAPPTGKPPSYPTMQEQIKSQRKESVSAYKKNNKIAPIQTQNLSTISGKQYIKHQDQDKKQFGEDYFQFEDMDASHRNQINDKNYKSHDFSKGKKQNQSISGINDHGASYALAASIDSYNVRGTQEGENAHQDTIQEISCLLDESILKKNLHIPDINMNKMEIENELGLVIQNEGHGFHEEINLQGDTSFYRIIDKDSIEIVESYTDRCPCLSLRKALMKLRVYINRFAISIITHKIFETISIFVIVANSLFLAMDDPLAVNPPVYQAYSDKTFLALYSTEMVLKILALGFIFNQGSYLRDPWNILDFVIVFSGYLSMFLQGGGANLSVLRSFRVIRPLRTISSIQGLRVIVQALLNSVPLLRDAILVLMFFFVIFAIGGCQLFQGVLKMQCVWIETGILDPSGNNCASDDMCLPGQFCGKSFSNPNYNTTSFDNILYALLLVFQTVTLEGWTGNMIALEQAVAGWTVVYFYPIVFIGAFFLLNLLLAVINSKFSEEMQKNKLSKKNGQKAKKKISKQRGVDDDTDNEEQEKLKELEFDDPQKYKEMLENMPMQAIEENPDIPPELKASIKQKRKLEELIKKMEFAIHQKEMQQQDATSPRFRKKGYAEDAANMKEITLMKTQSDSLSRRIEQLVVNMQNYGDLFRNKSEFSSPMLGQDIQKDVKSLPNVGQPIFLDEHDHRMNSKQTASFQIKGETIKEVDNESHEITVNLDEQPKTADIPPIKGQLKFQSIMGIKPKKGSQMPYHSQKLVKKNTLTKYFRAGRDMDSGNYEMRIAMNDIAGIKAKKPNGANDLAFYERISQDFDIFQFLDADDEKSGDELNPSGSNSLENDDDEFNDELQNGVNGNNQIERKTTIATAETKAFTKRNRRSSRDGNGADLNPQSIQNADIRSDLSLVKKRTMPRGRRKTVKLQMSDYKHIGDEEDDKDVEKISLKQKAINFFKRSPSKNSAKSKKVVKEVKKVTNQDLEERRRMRNQFKEEILSATLRSKSVSSSKPVIGSDLTTSGYNKLADGFEKRLLGYATDDKRKQTIKKKFEDAK